MVLCASNEDKTKIELVYPPTDAVIGENVYLEGASERNSQAVPDDSVNAKKKNGAWSLVVDDLRTDLNGFACYRGKRFMTSKGACKVEHLVNSQIS